MVPVWISFPNFKAHLYEKFALMFIAKTVGKLLFIDEATTNGSRSSQARVRAEYDCGKAPVDEVWIVVKDRTTKAVKSGYSQRVEFSKMPDYCDHCCHVGHSIWACLVLGNRSDKRRSGELKPSRVSKQPDCTYAHRILKPNEERIIEKRGRMDWSEHIENRKNLGHEEPEKQSLHWQMVRKSTKSGAKNSQGVEIE
ncbi:uncharacterized protein LOC110428790 [Herrania umbratica]|uniref:Uncharacterized protein LOC110428790 n=1 Tax=Herrania umbratica TaxID=108875 RepID=A0A6J1BLN8_9ROSI|nr:uncharacterized protein LOC110428790 [Herrania umbratica]